MKKTLTILVLVFLTASLFAQRRRANHGMILKDQVKVENGQDYISIEVEDSSMIDLNNRVKLMQKGDTLIILSRSQVIAKIAGDKVWFLGNGGVQANIGDTITFSDGSQIRNAQNGIIEFFPYNIDGDYSYLYRDNGHYMTFDLSRLALHATDTTINRYAGQIGYDGHKYYGFADGKWTHFGGGGTGTLGGTIALNHVPFGIGINTIGSDVDFNYDASVGQLYVKNALYTKNARSYINPAVSNSAGNIANLLGTNVTYSANAKMFQVNNLATPKFYVKNDTTVFDNYIAAKDSMYAYYAQYKEGQYFTMTPGNAMKPVSQIVSFQVVMPDTLAGTTIATGYDLYTVDDNTKGKNLIKVQVLVGESQGTAVTMVTAWRNRGGTEVNMTSTGGTFGTNATINTSNDDCALGDKIELRAAVASGTPPKKMKVTLYFQ